MERIAQSMLIALDHNRAGEAISILGRLAYALPFQDPRQEEISDTITQSTGTRV
jgi:hypothetical protein